MRYLNPVTKAQSTELSIALNAIGCTVKSTLTKHPAASVIIEGYRNGKPLHDCKHSCNWEDSAFHYVCELTLDGRKMSTPFKCGFGHAERRFNIGAGAGEWIITPHSPTPADIVHSLMLDSTCTEQTFEEFCSDTGTDTDSRKALELYLTCQQSGTLARKFLGKHFEALSKCEH